MTQLKWGEDAYRLALDVKIPVDAGLASECELVVFGLVRAHYDVQFDCFKREYLAEAIVRLDVDKLRDNDESLQLFKTQLCKLPLKFGQRHWEFERKSIKLILQFYCRDGNNKNLKFFYLHPGLLQIRRTEVGSSD